MNNSKLINRIKEFVVKEARGIKTISKDLHLVVNTMKSEVQNYLKYKDKDPKKAEKSKQKLLKLTTLKKKYANELDDKVAGLYKNAKLKVTD
jgi:DNA repair ATPase RecN